ncbi:type I polyketide synthase [Nocardia carnea]|uniref:type I polyketide synthase n=1 Tax=Nocardia carnea TaxID=37328 RepID=UPI002456EA93|nr:type I polyketide synthase [Nocardia carnea]
MDREEKTLEYLKRLTRELQSTRRRLAQYDDLHGPVAIVGAGCRFPGRIATRRELWDFVAAGRDAAGAFPTDRGWDPDLFDPDPEAPRKTYAREASFLYDAAEFDAGFFGIGPREALAMDPQQRILLEVAWEALEDSWIDPLSLRGTGTGVFAGVGGCMYGVYNDHELEGYRLSGVLGSVVSGRVAYALGLEGPAVTVDTACSSSLVAIHQACRALRSGECDLALAGGVTVHHLPTMFTEFSRQRGLSPDGRCKSFGAGADGVGWGEGAGLVVLERLSDARAAGRRVLGVVRGSAVNQDGASNGLTAPNGPSQVRVIRAALASAGLGAADVDAVEGHGTGTTLGDPIEAQALLSTYGKERPAGRPLWLGSVKSNVGHTQAAAGVAGVIKMVEAMRHGVLPRTLHAEVPSPHVEWSSGGVSLLTEPQQWPSTGVPRRVGVSSFGISGTNAHVILEEAPAELASGTEQSGFVSAGVRPDEVPRSAGRDDSAVRIVPWVMSARSVEAFAAQRERLRTWVADRPEATPDDVAVSLAGRSALEYRAVAVGDDRAGLLAQLPRLEAVGELPGDTVFVFPGQGAQYRAMGSQLYETFPVFADAVREICDPAWLFDPATDLDATENTQLALFAVAVGVFRLLESWGAAPDIVLGHSVGEIAAAHIAGVLSLADAVRLVRARGRLMAGLPAGGAMLAVGLSADAVGELPPGVSLAAVNGPQSVVVSGPESAIADLEHRWKGRPCRRLRVSHAFHSVLMDPVLDEFAAVCAELEWRPPVLSMVSTVTGQRESTLFADPGYWVRQVRETVRFADAVTAAVAAGGVRFVDIGPGTAASAMIAETVHPTTPPETTVTALLRPSEPEVRSLLTGLGRLWVTGGSVDWRRVLDGCGGRRLDLPAYAFQRRRYWLQPSLVGRGDAGLEPLAHPILSGLVVEPDTGGFRCTGRLSVAGQPWLADHRVLGQLLFPATGFADLALTAAAAADCAAVREMTLREPLVLPERDPVTVQVAVAGDDGTGARRFTVHATRDSRTWTCHAEGILDAVAPGPVASDLDTWPPADAVELAPEGWYEQLAAAGYEYGAAFRGLRRIWSRGEELFAEAEMSEHGAGADRFVLHPALFDAVLHAVAATGAGSPLLPFVWEGLSARSSGKTAVRARIAGRERVRVDIVDGTGLPVLSARSLVLRSASSTATDPGPERTLHTIEWQPMAERPAPPVAWARWPEITADSAVPDVVVAEFGSDAAEPDQPGAVRAATAAALRVAQDVIGDRRYARTRVVAVTRGAVAAPGAEVTDLAGAAARGLLRSVQEEEPGRFVLADLDTGAAIDDALVARLAGAAEPHLLVRSGEFRTARLVRMVPAGGPEPAEPPALDGSVLITGGTGLLGATMARHLVSTHGVRDLVLTSRSGDRAPGAAALGAELEAAGARVRFEPCDIADGAAVDHLVAAITARGRLAGVVHAAGVLDDGVATALTPERLAGVLAPKVDGAWHLHRATRDLDLSLFALFSSAAGVLGAPGQGNYAAANSYLDALAAYRRARGLPAISLAWGPWAGPEGMAGRLDDSARRRTARSGIGELSVTSALSAFDWAVRSAASLVVPVRLNFAAVEPERPVPSILTAVAPARQRPGTPARPVDLAAFPPGKRRMRIMELVGGYAAAVLGYSGADAIPPDRPFQELGFDSLAAIEFRNRIRAATGVDLPATVIFDYPTPEAIVDYLASRFPDAADEGAGSDEERIRATLATIPVERLRRAGLLEPLLDLAAGTGPAESEGGNSADRIRDMDSDSLVRLLLGEPDRDGAS